MFFFIFKLKKDNNIFKNILGSILSITVIVIGNRISDPEFKTWTRLFVSLSTNTCGKGMNPSVLPQAMGK